MNLNMQRRGFLQLGVNAIGSSTLLATLGACERVLAAAPPVGDYRALVCVYLSGGCDTANLIVPRSSNEYARYAVLRSTLALPRDSLLPLINASASVNYGLHPGCPDVRSLYNQKKLAVIGNVGPLAEPTTRADYLARRVELPQQLFSHNDQQRQMMAGGAGRGNTGWAGRIADLIAARVAQPALSMNISIAGSNIWQAGDTRIPYALNSRGVVKMPFWQRNDVRAVQRRELFTSLLDLADADANPLAQETSRIQRRAIDLGEQVSAALDQTSVPTTFPASRLGAQLAMVTRMIAARDALGVKRQMFFVSQSGYDTHNDQLQAQASLLSDLSNSLGAFQREIDRQRISSNVTAFTASEFGRTLSSNGDGSDHGWGAQSLVLGGAVNGGAIYGAMPSLVSGGEDDAGDGRIIPSIATEQVAATLASWYGLSRSDVDTVLPTLDRFASRDLGFMMA